MQDTPLLNTDVVFVLGMHRSGTSCLMGLLNASGVRMLDDAHIPKPTNPRGNFEYRAVRELNDEILQFNGGTWSDPPPTITVNEPLRQRMRGLLMRVTGPGLWGLKDPRMLFVLDAWCSHVQSSRLLGIFRHPWAVARSLADRPSLGLPIERGLALWLAYNRRLVALHKREALPLLCFDLDREEFLQQVAWAGEELGLRVEAGALRENFHNELVHHREDVTRPLTGELGAVYRYLWAHRVIPDLPTGLGGAQEDHGGDSAKAWMRSVTPPPIIVGATGGSGTRALARVCQRAGVHWSTRPNHALDCHNVARWVHRPWAAAWLDAHQHGASLAQQDGLNRDLARACRSIYDSRPEGVTRWGWKNPPNMMMFPQYESVFNGALYIHMIRDGRDMAVSPNQNQVRKFAEVLLSEQERRLSPMRQSLRLWARANLAAARFGETLRGSRYLRIRFEDLCDRPALTIARVLEFLDLDPGFSPSVLAGEIKPPSSRGRWRELRQEVVGELGSEEREALEQFDYAD